VALISELVGAAVLETRHPVSGAAVRTNAAPGMRLYQGDQLGLLRGKATLIAPREGIVHLDAPVGGQTNYWPPKQSSPSRKPLKELWNGVVETAMWVLDQRQEIAKGAVSKGDTKDEDVLRLVCLGNLPPRQGGTGSSQCLIFWTAPRNAEPVFDIVLSDGRSADAKRFLNLAPKQESEYGRVVLYSSVFSIPNDWPTNLVRARVANSVAGGRGRSNDRPWPAPLPPQVEELISDGEGSSAALDANPSLTQGLLLEAVKADALALRVYLACLQASPGNKEVHLALARLLAACNSGTPARSHQERGKP